MCCLGSRNAICTNCSSQCCGALAASRWQGHALQACCRHAQASAAQNSVANVQVPQVSVAHVQLLLLQDCQPLWLKAQDGSAFKFVGAAELVKGTVAVDAAFVPPDALGGSAIQPLTSAQLANQVQLRAREFISQYYDGWLKSDDELLPVETRNVSLRTLAEGKPGTAPPTATQQGHMARTYTEADLYTQLAHFARLLDAEQAAQQLEKEVDRQAALDRIAPVRASLAAGLQAIKKLQDANAYRWISLQSLYDVKPQVG